MKKKIVVVFLWTAPAISIAQVEKTSSGSVKQHRSVSTVSSSAKPLITTEPVSPNFFAPETIVQETEKPLILTVFNCNTATQVNDGRSIIVRAHYVVKNSQFQEVIKTKTLSLVGSAEAALVGPDTIRTLQAPDKTFEIWAEEVTDSLWTEDIDHNYPATQKVSSLSTSDSIFIFSVIGGVPTLQATSQLQSNNLIFSNQTDQSQTITFSESKSFVGFSYLAKQLSFTVLPRTLLTLPAPSNATSFTIGNNTITPLPISKTVYSLTPQKLESTTSPYITILPISAA